MKGFVLGVLAAATLALAAGIAYAAIPDANSKVFTACMLKNVGTIRLIDPSLGTGTLLGKCSSLEQQVTWNQEGPAGKSPTVTQLATGDGNCPSGGAAITDAAGTTAYVCNGKDGEDGADFDGSFTSPNGSSKLNVTDTGIELKSATTLSVEASGPLSIKGALVNINGPGCHQAARSGDLVQTVLPGGDIFPGGAFFGTILLGSPTVCIGP
jgi:hypothetical protein